MTQDFQGKTALITGLGRKNGIGMALAEALAKRGCNVFFTYFYSDGAKAEMEDVFETLNLYDVQIEGMEVDFASPDAAAALFSTVQEKFGTIDILINNAAYSKNDDIETISSESIDQHYFVNVRTPLLLAREFYNHFSKKSGGRIINLTSGQALTPMPHELAYVVSKGAMDTFTQNVAGTLMKKGITINSVDPGATDTGWMTNDMRAQFAQVSPLGRVGNPEDLVPLVMFLASEEAGYITGQVIHSRGGV